MFTDRLIFGPFRAGTRSRYADPLRVRRRLSDALDGDADTAVAGYHTSPPAAQERVLDAFRQAVDEAPLDPVTGEGMTDAQADEALRDFYSFVQVCVTEGPNSQTSSASTPA